MNYYILNFQGRCFILLLLLYFQSINLGAQNPLFTHGVASGDPLPKKVIIWTRISPKGISDSEIEVKWFVSEDTLMDRFVTRGVVKTSAHKDYTVKVDVSGLKPSTTYYYAFSALGASSSVGRTKTAPDIDEIKAARFAVVAGNQFQTGYFHSYSHLSSRNDLSAVIHLGDYIYEDSNPIGSVYQRFHEPNSIAVSLEDYRKRYGQYRSDKNLKEAHRQLPFICVWNDREFSREAYRDGARGYSDGSPLWEERKKAAIQAYLEWMPVRLNPDSNIYRKVSYGKVVDFLMLDERIAGRENSPSVTNDSSFRTMLGESQKSWLLENLSGSSANWKMIGNPMLFSPVNLGFASGYLDGQLDITNIDSILRVESSYLEIWDGYVKERNQILDTISKKKLQNIVFLSGGFNSAGVFEVTKNPVDYPNSLFNNLPTPNSSYDRNTGKGSLAIEFATPSISAPNFDEEFGSARASGFESSINSDIAIDLNGNTVNYNPHLKYIDLDRHGYFVLSVNADTAQADFYFTGIEASKEPLEFDKGYFTISAQSSRVSVSTQESEIKTEILVPAPIAVFEGIPEVSDTIKVVDTTIVYDTIHIEVIDTTIISIIDTVEIEKYDTLVVTVNDTVDIIVFDSVRIQVFDTLIFTLYDTVTISDTVLVIDTIHVFDTLVINAPNVESEVQLKLYPNPVGAGYDVQLRVSSAEGLKGLDVFDGNGKIIGHFDTNRSDRSAFNKFFRLGKIPNPGIYFVRLNFLDESYFRKLIVK